MIMRWMSAVPSPMRSIGASRYDVLCEQAVIGEARKILGLGGTWPPEPPGPTATAPTQSAIDEGVQKTGDAVAEATDGLPPATA